MGVDLDSEYRKSKVIILNHGRMTGLEKLE